MRIAIKIMPYYAIVRHALSSHRPTPPLKKNQAHLDSGSGDAAWGQDDGQGWVLTERHQRAIAQPGALVQAQGLEPRQQEQGGHVLLLQAGALAQVELSQAGARGKLVQPVAPDARAVVEGQRREVAQRGQRAQVRVADGAHGAQAPLPEADDAQRAVGQRQPPDAGEARERRRVAPVGPGRPAGLVQRAPPAAAGEAHDRHGRDREASSYLKRREAAGETQ